LEWEPTEIPRIWNELGRDLALLHLCMPLGGRAAHLPQAEALPDPRKLAEDRATDGWFTSIEVRWLTRWLDRLAPAVPAPLTKCMLHLDVQATNILIDPTVMEYRAVLDWGCAGLGDPAWDFFGMPLLAVPAMLDGHRSIAPLDGDDTVEARILWRHLQYSLAILPRGSAPGLSWGERPMAWLLEVFRFFTEPVGARWQDLRPL
jgi:Ser/Thr protein kinase RdoA (MazF antagonist)